MNQPQGRSCIRGHGCVVAPMVMPCLRASTGGSVTIRIAVHAAWRGDKALPCWTLTHRACELQGVQPCRRG